MNVWKSITCLCVFLLSFCTTTVFAQQISISGTVSDIDGTMPGVTVRLVGTIVGTSTDANGRYQITVPNDDAVLLFTFIGYADVQRVVGSQRVIDIVMSEQGQTMEEVVVIGYGKQTKASVTSSIVSIATEELLKSPTTSLGNAMAGRLPGFAAIQYSGLPGFDDPQVFIRGIGSLNADRSSPLILVDGVERGFTQIDPNEVADISILKDAGATAVFGVRGANGVILVTTKRGTTGKPKITASGSFGIQQPTKIPKSANSYTYALKYTEAQRTDNYGDANTRYTFNSEAIEHYRKMDQPVLYPSIDWLDYLMNNHAFQNQFNINVSGGNEKARYFVSIGRLFQDGLFKVFDSIDPRENFKYNRYNYRANIDIDLTKTSALSVSLGGRIEDRNTLGDSDYDGDAREGSIFRYLMECPPMSGAGLVDGEWVTHNINISPLPRMRDGMDVYYGRGFKNDVANIVNFDMEFTQKLNVITKGLSARFKGSYNMRFSQEKARVSGGSRSAKARYIPEAVYNGSGDITGYVLAKDRDMQPLGYSENFGFGRDWYFEGSLNYSRRFGSHNVSGLMLYNQTKKYYPDNYTDIPNSYIGIVGRITYDYQMKYLVDLNMGYNGSENFADGKRFGFFPSTSAGWILTEEDFMKTQNIVNYLKLRYSFGIVGNDRGVGRFVYMPPSYSMTSRPRGGSMDGTYFGDYLDQYWESPRGLQRMVSEATIGNPDVSWEKSRKQNFGLDLKAVNNRLGVNIDFFTEHRWDILVSTGNIIPTIFSLPQNPSINYGIVENKGYEIILSWSDKIGNDIRYSISPNMAYSKNKIVEQLEIPPVHEYLRRTGHKVNQPWGFDFVEFYEPGESEKRYKERYNYSVKIIDASGNEEEINFPNHGFKLRAGDLVFRDLNEDGEIDGNDQKAIGYTQQPEYNFGLTLTFKYKRFDLSMLWIGATNVTRPMGTNYQETFGSMDNGPLLQYVADNAWSADNPNPKLPRITFVNKNHNSRYCSVYQANGSYIRLKNLELGYDFDVSTWPFMDGARLFVTGYNLLTFSEFKANDPETSAGEFGSWFRYPPTRVFNFGVRFSF